VRHDSHSPTGEARKGIINTLEIARHGKHLQAGQQIIKIEKLEYELALTT
jgi:hypothetical protein